MRVSSIFAAVALAASAATTSLAATFTIAGTGLGAGNGLSGSLTIDDALVTPDQSNFAPLSDLPAFSLNVTFQTGASPIVATFDQDDVGTFLLQTDSTGGISSFNLFFVENAEGFEVNGFEAFRFRVEGTTVMDTFTVTSFTPAAIPLPASGLMLIGGVALAGFAARRRKGATAGAHRAA